MEFEMEVLMKFAAPGIAFLFTLIFGFWLSNSGKPYNGVLFNFHKLMALGAVILTTVQIYKIISPMETQTLTILLIVLVGLSVVVLFATGAFMSLEKFNYGFIVFIHRVSPVLAILLMTAVIVLLIGKNK
jgi:hypothetical protein